MKNLDKTKAYDLRDLNDEHKKEVLGWLQKKEMNQAWNYFLRHTKYLMYDRGWYEGSDLEEMRIDLNNKYPLVNALELFELQIGDTFEYNGYICEVKEPIKRWVYDTYQEVYYKTSKIDQQTMVITNQQLIKLLEENEIH